MPAHTTRAPAVPFVRPTVQGAALAFEPTSSEWAHALSLRVRGGGCCPSKQDTGQHLDPPHTPEQPFIQDLDPPHTLAPKIYRALTALDDRLVGALAAGDIRLVRAAWLQKQPAGYRIQRRQVLEELECRVSPTPLMRPAEAVALIRAGNRSAGAVTHGWCARPHRIGALRIA
jgi:hypothetical protein